MQARPPGVDFFISNDRHHTAMCQPVLAALGDSCRCRVLSLCELRGLVSPSADRLPAATAIHRLLPLRIRRSPSTGRAAQPGQPARRRRVLRQIIWWLLLAPRLRALLYRRPDLAVLPNDAAYPYDRIARLLERRRIPFLLLQEGIRFPLQTGESAYGAGGAVAIAAWGEASARYFRAVGAPAASLHLTGSPRFDRLTALAAGAERRQARALWGLPARTLLLLSNPIDDQGFCSHQQKMKLIARFLEQIDPAFVDGEFHLAIKLHGREDPLEFEALIPPALRQRISIFPDAPLWELLGAARAAVILASTVGLEALLCGLPLAVLELPGHGFQYDYVPAGAAVGLTWSRPMAPQVVSLLNYSEERKAQVERYLRNQFEVRVGAASRVAELIHHLLAQRR